MPLRVWSRAVSASFNSIHDSIDPGKGKATVMTMDRVDAYLESHRSDFEEQLKALIRIPSISAQPDHDADTRRAATSSATTWRRWDSRPS